MAESTGSVVAGRNELTLCVFCGELSVARKFVHQLTCGQQVLVKEHRQNMQRKHKRLQWL